MSRPYKLTTPDSRASTFGTLDAAAAARLYRGYTAAEAHIFEKIDGQYFRVYSAFADDGDEWLADLPSDDQLRGEPTNDPWFDYEEREAHDAGFTSVEDFRDAAEKQSEKRNEAL